MNVERQTVLDRHAEATAAVGFAPVYEGLTPGNTLLCAVIQHKTRLFLLSEGDFVMPLDHDRYVALIRGEAVATEYAGRSFILVDCYLRLAGNRPEAVVNETCSWLVFDAQGLLDLPAALEIDADPAPREAQWAQVRALAFADSESSQACI